MNELEKAVLAVMITQELLKNEKKILAIKIIRFMYGADLRDGKDFVDRLETR
ncbi:hypothetical protein LCGC14_0814940 [marine sediment metagenome]|uniref:Uncharacterized protein n=1 Tax=marine sediment metagenome TaxID=412755 RepID=A0A0F9PQ74_9ZZZZ